MAALVDGFDVASAGELGQGRAPRPADQLRRSRQARPGAGNRDPRRRDHQPRKRRRGGAGAGDLRAGRTDGRSWRCGSIRRSGSRARARKWAGCRASSGSTMTARPRWSAASSTPAPTGRACTSSPAARRSHADALIELQRDTVALAASIAEEAGHAPPHVNLGGGFGIPYFAKDQPLDVEAVGAALAKTLADRPKILAEHRIRDRAGPLAGGRGGRLSDPHRRPQGKPRQDLPGHRRRPPPPARRVAAISASCCAATIRSPSPAASAPSRRRRRPSPAASAPRSTCSPTKRCCPAPRSATWSRSSAPAPTASAPARRHSSASRWRGKCWFNSPAEARVGRRSAARSAALRLRTGRIRDKSPRRNTAPPAAR